MRNTNQNTGDETMQTAFLLGILAGAVWAYLRSGDRD
jgi:hypothetical protein